MNIRLHVEPNIPFLTWEHFKREAPPFSVALDGYVRGAPTIDPKGPWVNFNHHEGVDRLATRSTCAQVLISMRQGLFSTLFQEAGEPHVEVFVNDCDEDVCTAWTLINHQHLVAHSMNPLVNRLVAMEDHLDCTAGAYPFPADLPALRELAWIFEPYRQFRLSGQLDKRDPKAFRSVITDVGLRIIQHVTGHGKEVPIDTRYERIGGGKDWVMVKEIGAQARTGMFAEGVRSFISVRELGEGRWNYVIGKMAPFIRRDLLATSAFLNIAEGAKIPAAINHEDRWGGSNIIIGSPRVNGSVLSPDEVATIYEKAKGW